MSFIPSQARQTPSAHHLLPEDPSSLPSAIVTKERLSDFMAPGSLVAGDDPFSAWSSALPEKRPLAPPILSPGGENDLFTCTVQKCARTFSNVQELEAHIDTHRHSSRYPCAYCTRGFEYKSLWTRHMRVHTDERPYSCHLCPESRKCKSDLKKHLKTHSNERDYKCDVCEKTCLQKSDLEEHTRVHTGERPFKCVDCPAAFAQSRNLVNHRKKVHSGRGHYICPHSGCSSSFIKKGSLTTHLNKYHLQESPRSNRLRRKDLLPRQIL